MDDIKLMKIDLRTVSIDLIYAILEKWRMNEDNDERLSDNDKIPGWRSCFVL